MLLHYFLIISTYHRPELLGSCLTHIQHLSYDIKNLGIQVYDNDFPQDSCSLLEKSMLRPSGL